MNRVLVVEDEPAIALGLEDDLRLEGYEVEVLGDGQAAFERAHSAAFDLILLDVMLPGKDGLSICRELRAAGVQTPIILLTAKGQELDKVLGLELGADDYVTKPFSPRELLARVKAALRRSGGSLAAVDNYQIGDIRIDFDRFEATRRGERIDLTALEFKLLRTFVQHRRSVLTREQLLDDVWGKDVFITDRVVDTHITNLRKKIEPNPAQPRYLVSVRGVGYRFDE